MTFQSYNQESMIRTLSSEFYSREVWIGHVNKQWKFNDGQDITKFFWLPSEPIYNKLALEKIDNKIYWVTIPLNKSNSLSHVLCEFSVLIILISLLKKNNVFFLSFISDSSLKKSEDDDPNLHTAVISKLDV